MIAGEDERAGVNLTDLCEVYITSRRSLPFFA